MDFRVCQIGLSVQIVRWGDDVWLLGASKCWAKESKCNSIGNKEQFGFYWEYNSGDSMVGCSLSRRNDKLNQGNDKCKTGWYGRCNDMVPGPS